MTILASGSEIVPGLTSVVVAPPAPPAAPAVAAPAAAPAPEVHDPAWLADRLKRAEEKGAKGQLAALGVASVDEAKAAVEAARAAAEAKKSLEDKYSTANTELATIKTRLSEYEQAVSAHADREMAKLTPAQKAAVENLAGADKAAQLKYISALSVTWTAEAPAAAATVVVNAAAKAPIAAPAASTPAITPPAPPASSADTNHAATYASLQATNPFRAAAYFAQHQAAILSAKS
jgi:hypothetical protein